MRAILADEGQFVASNELPSEVQVRIYGQNEIVAVQGRQIDILVTDLDRQSLEKLLAWWEAVPRLAKELHLHTIPPFNLPETIRHVVVLGSDGRIAISGPGGQDLQSINILSDDMTSQTTIAVHAFAPEAELAVEQLGRQFNQVRGPPRSAVQAGEISLPPPEENVTILVVGRIGTLDIDGPTDDAQQSISFTGFLNRHCFEGDMEGVPAGQPFAVEAALVAERLAPYENPVVSSEDNSQDSFSDLLPGNNSQPIVMPVTPTLPGNVPFQPPLTLPGNEFKPFVPTTVLPPPPVFRGPVFTPRFGS